MSLINDALKKAQRQRAESPNEADAASDGSVVKRRQPRSIRSLLILGGAAAAVLVVLSVVFTVFFLNQPEPPPPVAAKPPPPKETVPASTPVVTPVANAPEAATAPPPASLADRPAIPAAAPAASPVVVLPPGMSPVGAAAAGTAPAVAPEATGFTPLPLPPPPPARPVTPRFDERIQAYIDTLRISAVRPLGEDSRVLMNDRMYRLNEIIDRNLGVRLIKVEPGKLTFSDASGMQYVRTL